MLQLFSMKIYGSLRVRSVAENTLRMGQSEF